MFCAYRALALSYAVLSLSSMLNAQPTACTEDSQCPSRFYCEESVLICRECIRCEDLKREPPPPPDVCVKSVLQCGLCLKGLVEDLRLDRACVLLSDRSDSSPVLPPYAWVFIGLLFVGFIVIVVYVLWRKDSWFSYIFRIRTSTCASVHQNGNCVVPSAHEPPPPYNPYYESVRPKSPSETNEQLNGEDSTMPFIKRAASGQAQGPREFAGYQEAHPYNNPAYIRGPAPGFGNHQEESDPTSFIPLPDEDTMESPWTPNEPINNYNSNISENATDGVVVPTATGEAASALAAPPARRSSVDAGPPAKAARLREDTNNNRGRESNNGSGPESPRAASPPPAPAHSLVINVVTNINNLEQRNSVNLPKH